MKAIKFCSLLVTFAGITTAAFGAEQYPPAQVKRGAEIYAANCATCHGNRMKNPPWAIDLATFPRDQPARFGNSVTYGLGNMPPWGDVLKPEDIAALWSYLVAGEKGD